MDKIKGLSLHGERVRLVIDDDDQEPPPKLFEADLGNRSPAGCS